MADYNVDNLKRNKPGKAREESDNEIVPKGGVYVHPEALDENGKPATLIAVYDPLFGNAQAEGFKRLGYVYERDATPDELHTIVGQAKAGPYNSDTVESDKQRLDALELESLRREKREREQAEEEAAKTVKKAEDNRSKDALDESGKTAKANAEKETKKREEGNDSK